MQNKKGKKKLKGCFQRSLIPSFLIIFCIIVAIITCFPLCKNMGKLTDYVVLVKELSQSVSEDEVAPDKVGPTDDQNMMSAVLSFAQNKNGDAIFDEKGNFIEENTKPENLEYLTDGFSLNKRTLASFVNSLIGAGWIDGFYNKQDSSKFISVLEVFSLNTEEDETTIKFVCKVNLEFFIDVDKIDATMKELLDELGRAMYLTYESKFNSEGVLSSKLWVNKISEKSNDLFIRIITNDISGEKVDENLNSIMATLLDQLKIIKTSWGIDYQFVGEELVFSLN